MKKMIVALALALALTGCTTADTTNESSKEFATHLTFNVSEGSYVNFSNEVSTSSAAESEINAENDPSMKIAPKTNLGLNGSPTLAEEGAGVSLEGITHGIELVTEVLTPSGKDPIVSKPSAPVWSEGQEGQEVLPGDTEVTPLINSSESLVQVYDVDTYKDGRMRYLLRGTMEKLPNQFSIFFKGEKIFDVDKKDTGRFSVSAEHGERWEADGRMNTIMKNSDGRKESITVLLDQDFGSNPQKGDMELRGVAEGEVANWHGVNKDNHRPVWYFKEMMVDYPAEFTIKVDGCSTLVVTGNEGQGQSFDGMTGEVLPAYSKSRDVYSIRQSEVKPRGMVLIGPRSCESKVASLK